MDCRDGCNVSGAKTHCIQVIIPVISLVYTSFEMLFLPRVDRSDPSYMFSLYIKGQCILLHFLREILGLSILTFSENASCLTELFYEPLTNEYAY